MNPQCGYYANGQSQQFTSNGRNQGTYGRQTTYGGTGGTGACRPMSRTYTSSARNQPLQTQSANGFYSNQGARARAPPVFSTSSAGNFGSQRGYPQQSSCTNRNGTGNNRQQQRVGGAIPVMGNNHKMGYQQPQKCSQQHPLAPAPFCTPQAIKVNITADQLANAQSTPYQDRGEPGVDSGAKYIQLNWQDLLGGMDNLRVTMAPSADPCNQNQQLRVSFGGQKNDPPQAGETCLKVVSIEPASTGRMDLQQGKALAGAMKICNSPITNVVPMNTNNACMQPMQRPQPQLQQNQRYCGGGNRKNMQSGCCPRK